MTSTLEPSALFSDPWLFYGAVNNQFRLSRADGTGACLTLEVVEDEQDGYRSTMKHLAVVESSTEIFYPTPLARVTVAAVGDAAEVYEVRDCATGHVWLTFGTDNADDYYPMYVFRYTPVRVVCYTPPLSINPQPKGANQMHTPAPLPDDRLAALAALGGDIADLAAEVRTLRSKALSTPPPTAPPASPRRAGNNVIIRTVTCYYTGRIEAIAPEEIVLSSAAWIADTGRWSTALETGKLNEVEPFSGNGVVSIGAASIVDITDWRHALPRSVK